MTDHLGYDRHDHGGNGGARKREADGSEHAIHARDDAGGEPVVAVSGSHGNAATQQFLEKIGRHRLVRRGSLLKCCLIAEGKADFYPRFGKTCEWDTAAGAVPVGGGRRLVDRFLRMAVALQHKGVAAQPVLRGLRPGRAGLAGARLNQRLLTFRHSGSVDN